MTNSIATRTEGCAIRYFSKELIKNEQGEYIPKEMGYVKSPSIYPKPLAEAIVSLIQSTEYKYHVFWVPSFEIIEADVEQISLLSYQDIDWSFLERLPNKIGEINDPCIGWIAKKTMPEYKLNVGHYSHGTSSSNLSEVQFMDTNTPDIKHFLIDKSWL